ncbi:hypothetical protein UC34_19855 [Pandoraea vervacti]|uniref:N-acetylmuramoyl-L-alanine amidase n=1 Tax=Pandoraea vervacti TaxID=656178 RepID=A0ABM6FRG8_9BURK|nr:hypothetical protein UC34_19855 [Pandoraea vervacti]
MLNASSIGISIVNPGFEPTDKERPLAGRRWHAYPYAQIDVVCQLATAIVQRHRIASTRVVGHADIAPGRKVDPGPHFPWKRLYERGLGAWPNEATVACFAENAPYRGDIAALQAKLLAYGYDTPQSGELDDATRHVVQSFQMHFCPTHRYDGVPDVLTVAVLDALLEKYFGAQRPAC